MEVLAIISQMVVQHKLSYQFGYDSFSGSLRFPPPMFTEDILLDSPNEEVRGILQRRQLANQLIRENLIKAQERINKYANRRRKEREFAVGDMVYLKIQPYKNTSFSLHRSLKLHPKFYGPFQVLERIGMVAYKLLLPDSCQLHLVFHVSQLKKHLGSKVIPSPKLPLTDSEENLKVYPVAIIERRMVPRNNEPIIQWLIQWVNLPLEATTWENTDFIAKVFLDFHS